MVAPQDEEGLQKAVLELIESPELRENLGELVMKGGLLLLGRISKQHLRQYYSIMERKEGVAAGA